MFKEKFEEKMAGNNMYGRNVVNHNLVFGHSVAIRLALGALFAVFCLLPACSINVDKDDNKEGSKHVDIKSPMGDLHVSEQADIRDAGLSVYPGATPAPKDNHEEGGNVNLALPGFQLKVVAGEFFSDDAPDKIVAYYDKELQKFGKPIQCRGSYSNGGNVESHGKDELEKPVTCDKTESGDGLELKVGTKGNQHLVAVKPNSKGTRFALVYVRLHTGKDTTI
jgi:hypothetical protein